MLDPGLARMAGRQVHVQLHGEMRRQGHAGLLGQGLHAQIRGDAADPRRIRHQEVGGALADELPVLGRAGEHLAGGNQRVEPNLSRSRAPRWRD
jgi:hypothetical protein